MHVLGVCLNCDWEHACVSLAALGVTVGVPFFVVVVSVCDPTPPYLGG